MAQSLALRKYLADIAEANKKFDREVDIAEAARSAAGGSSND